VGDPAEKKLKKLKCHSSL